MFEQSATTKTLVELLRTVNGQIGYDTITAYVKMPLDKIRPALSSARRILEKEKIVFGVERGVGLRRLSDQQAVQSTEKFKKRIRNNSKLGIKRLNAVSEFSRLSISDQLTATINRTLFETIKHHTSVKPAEAVKVESAAQLTPLLKAVSSK